MTYFISSYKLRVLNKHLLVISATHFYTQIKIKHQPLHCVKSVRIRSHSGPYSVRMWENTDQNNSEYGHFSAVLVSTPL